jgi:hypothetical protein
MALDLSSYKVAFQEGSSSTKFDNLVQAAQDSFNAIGDTSKMSWAAGLIFDPAQIKQNAAANNQALLWNGSAWVPTSLTLSKLAQSGAALNDVPQWNGSAWVPAAVTAPTTYRKTTAKTVNTSVAPTDLLNGEITIGAGVLGTNKLARLTAFGDYKQNSGGATNALRFQLLLGATTLFDTGAPALSLPNSATRESWRIWVEILNTASGAQVAHFKIEMAAAGAVNGNAAFTTGEGVSGSAATGNITQFILGDAYNASAEDTTTSKALVLNIINPSASATCETVLKGALVEIA